MARHVDNPEGSMPASTPLACEWSSNDFLLAVIDVILIPGFFASDGEMQTVTGFSRQEYEDLRSKIASEGGVFALFDDYRSMMLAALNNISGYPHAKDDLVRKRLHLEDRPGWHGSLFERLLPFMPGYRD